MKPQTTSLTAEHYVRDIRNAFKKHADRGNAIQMRAYLKNKFEFFGIKTPLRRVISKEFISDKGIPAKDSLNSITARLFEEEERELHHFAVELMPSYRSSWTKDDSALFESMVVRKSWWDTVDSIRSFCLHEYFLKFPGQQEPVTARWLDSGNLWLQRLAIIFQIGFKDRTDTDLLARNIDALSDSDEFFIQKAIGWALREYRKTDPDFVVRFADTRDLKPLSRREALRRIDT